MKYVLGDNPAIECKSVYVKFLDGTTDVFTNGVVYINPTTIKSMEVSLKEGETVE